MKGQLDKVANISVIALCFLLGFTVLRDKFFHSPPSSEAAIAPGTILPATGACRWNGHDRTLVLFLRSGCTFCERSTPFYQRLARMQKERQSSVRLIALFPDGVDTVNSFLQSHGLDIQAEPLVDFGAYNVPGTPTLALVDQKGRVLRTWIGQLPGQSEADVIAALAPGGQQHPRS